jgi:type II secretory pathway pseudopilin PulG
VTGGGNFARAGRFEVEVPMFAMNKNVGCRKRRAFTLLQILIVIAVVAILAAILLPTFSRSRASARRAQCDVRLKAIALALDAYRQENARFPRSLEELRADNLLNDPEALRCPSDPRPVGEGSYDDYYVVRAARDESDLPVLVCPFHEEDGHGAQAYKGRYTTQLDVKPAEVVEARNVIVQRPGKKPIAAAAGMTLRGGDRLLVGASSDGSSEGLLGEGGLLGTGLLASSTPDSGAAKIRFADGSTATLQGGCDVTVLQSFLMGSTNAPLYTLIKQRLGQVTYDVHTGSSFDVATPTATAGARGTSFTVKVNSDGSTDLVVIDGKVLFSTLNRSVVAPLGRTVTGLLNGLINIL